VNVSLKLLISSEGFLRSIRRLQGRPPQGQ